MSRDTWPFPCFLARTYRSRIAKFHQPCRGTPNDLGEFVCWFRGKWKTGWQLYMCQGLNSHYFHIIGDGHQPNSRGLYTHYKDSRHFSGGRHLPSPKYRDNLDHGDGYHIGKEASSFLRIFFKWVAQPPPRINACWFSRIVCTWNAS